MWLIATLGVTISSIVFLNVVFYAILGIIIQSLVILNFV